MTATTGFILAAALLVLIVLTILLRPLFRARRHSVTVNRRDANLQILRDQMTELERDRDEGSLVEADFEQARGELQRRLLEEVQPEVALPSRTGGRKTALALLVAIPLAAAAGYWLLGNPQALDPMHRSANMEVKQMDDLLGRLVEKLKANPGDTKGWVMLARSYKTLGRFSESADAYSHATALIDTDASLMADYADSLIQANGGRFSGKPGELVARALKISPDEPQALFLAGLDASEREDFTAVVDYWGRLLLQVEPDSEDAKNLGDAVDKAREALARNGGGQGKKMPAAPTGSKAARAT